eukprot:CAMPEP_0168367310 /NCGR_PEP_ID=MMETSP0228-20121227/5675_1 /TAXON_ID=133427 /ORGANISM="Protoceratium reticulatum, Strain CCCM 535 (=CCMP 1889)" /LENGTH=349 /DNA_ID=CAMNT_0008380133 /DNA_START=24 /DNA_END=1070 /DNA_ORIENTATION=-
MQPLQGRPMTCTTTHLTLFAAIFRGIVATLTCSHVSLLSRRAFASAFLALLGAAMALDCRRRGLWADEDFFVAPRRPSELSESSQASAGARDEGCCARCEHAAGPLKDGMDDLMNSFFEYFSELRALMDHVFSGASETSKEWGNRRLSTSWLGKLATVLHGRVTERMVSANLMIHRADTNYVMRDKSLAKLARGARTPDHPGRSKLLATRTKSGLDTHEDGHGAHRWRRFPCMALSVFLVQNPIGDMFLHSIFISSTMRVFLFACQMFGALAIGTLFATLTSRTATWDNDPDACDMEGIWERLGRGRRERAPGEPARGAAGRAAQARVQGGGAARRAAPAPRVALPGCH